MSDDASPRNLSKTDVDFLHFNEHNQCVPDAERALNAIPVIELWQTRTYRSRNEVTATSQNSHDGQHRLASANCPSMGQGKAIPSKLPDHDDYLVEFDGSDDTLHPINWRLSTK